VSQNLVYVIVLKVMKVTTVHSSVVQLTAPKTGVMANPMQFAKAQILTTKRVLVISVPVTVFVKLDGQVNRVTKFVAQEIVQTMEIVRKELALVIRDGKEIIVKLKNQIGDLSLH